MRDVRGGHHSDRNGGGVTWSFIRVLSSFSWALTAGE